MQDKKVESSDATTNDEWRVIKEKKRPQVEERQRESERGKKVNRIERTDGQVFGCILLQSTQIWSHNQK